MEWPVIINNSLQGTDWEQLLKQLHMKLRASNSTIENSIIFPKSGVAFLILPLTTCTVGQYDVKPDVLQLVEKFTKIHANGYALALASLHGEQERRIFYSIQSHFLATKLQMIPIHNVDEGIEAMVSISKVLCKPASDVMHGRLHEWSNQVNMEDCIKLSLTQIGMAETHIHMLQDCLGSLSNIAKADKEQLLESSINMETADSVIDFFNKKPTKSVLK